MYFLYRLTEREKKERDYKKKLLNLARDHDRARELERIQRYHMPQDKKVSLHFCCYDFCF